MTERTSQVGRGLMAFFTDIGQEYEPQYRRWHNCEHMPERVSIPGFIEGRRYLGSDGSPGFLMMYKTDAVEVLESSAYLSALNNPTRWTKEALKHFRNPLRAVYKLLSARGDSDFFAATWLLTIRFNSDAAVTIEQANSVIDDVQDENLCSFRFYEINDPIAPAETTEKAIYGEGDTAKRYLVLLESSDVETLRTRIERRRDGLLYELLQQDETVLVDEYSIEYYLRSR